MNPATRTPTAKNRQKRWPLGLVCTLVLASVFLGGHDARAAEAVFSGVRVAKSFDKFNDVWQISAVARLRPPRRLRAEHLEFAAGAFSSPTKTRPFASLGPVWKFRNRSQRLSLALGFSATLLGGSTLADRDLGGNLHFTSSVTLGAHFGRQREYELALRVQHTSNGGLNSTNPGLDAVALTFSIDSPTR